MEIYVTQTRLETLIESGKCYARYPAHISIFLALANHVCEDVKAVYIADLRKVLSTKKIKAIGKLFPGANIVHCSLDQPAHSIISLGDPAKHIIIATEFGTAGEVLTSIRDNKIVTQIRGYEKSPGLLLNFAAEYLNVGWLSFDKEAADPKYLELIKAYDRRIVLDPLTANHIDIQVRLYKWLYDNLSNHEVIPFVQTYFYESLLRLGYTTDTSLYPPGTDTLIPIRMHQCQHTLQKYNTLTETS